MSFAPYLNFDGNCREAMTFYAGVFGAADLQFMDGSAVPPDSGAGDMTDRVMHSQFTAGPGAPLMASDLPKGMAPQGRQLTVFHAANSVAAARGIFDALAAGGEVQFPFGPTFWSAAFGGVVDKFGTSWMITVAPGAV